MTKDAETLRRAEGDFQHIMLSVLVFWSTTFIVLVQSQPSSVLFPAAAAHTKHTARYQLFSVTRPS